MLVGGTLAMLGLMLKNSQTPQAFVNNILAAHASALVAYAFRRMKVPGNLSGTKAFLNGALAGLVSILIEFNVFNLSFIIHRRTL